MLLSAHMVYAVSMQVQGSYLRSIFGDGKYLLEVGSSRLYLKVYNTSIRTAVGCSLQMAKYLHPKPESGESRHHSRLKYGLWYDNT
jgi:hypothetical protein